MFSKQQNKKYFYARKQRLLGFQNHKPDHPKPNMFIHTINYFHSKSNIILNLKYVEKLD